ncbi:MAG: hypothetical protein HY332_10835 [Chloroflexi bacterium]|nr:hypothetical protein [Chloroflexota bacterium]
MKPSLFSRIVLTGVCVAAAAGWFGVGAAPAEKPPTAGSVAASLVQTRDVAPVDGAQPGVRNRAAWQPSPIPSPYSQKAPSSQPAQQVPAPAAPASNTASTVSSAPSAGRDRSAWQPSPVASQNGQKSQVARPDAPMPGFVIAAPLPVLGGDLGDRAVAPSSLPLTPPAVAPQPGGLAGLLGRFLGTLSRPIFGPFAGTTDAAAAPASPAYIPGDRLFTADRLEAIFDGARPEPLTEWTVQRFYSRALEREASYVVWLPADYATAKRTYPTLYLLHGVGGEEGYGPDEWIGYALTEDLERMLALGLIEPMIVVLPEGEQGYWMNHADGGPRWADFVAIDLVKHVDATFRTDARREKRAIGGLSMGAHGALQISLNYAGVFGVAGAHSPTIRPFETSPDFFGDPKWFARFDPLSLATNSDAAQRIATWIDIGNEDTWLPSAEALRRVYAAKKAPLEFRVLEGEHEGWYWAYYLPEYLHFYSTALNATATTPRGAPVVTMRPLVEEVALRVPLGGNGKEA